MGVCQMHALNLIWEALHKYGEGQALCLLGNIMFLF